MTDAPLTPEPAEPAFHRISPKQQQVEIWGTLITAVLLVGATVFVWLVWNWWTSWYAPAALGLYFLIYLVSTPRRIRAIGYALREDDLLFRKGLLVRKQVAVPYGRMQLIDISRGPIARAYGLAGLTFHTAASSANVSIEGLEAEVAEELRDRLVALAETRRAGL